MSQFRRFQNEEYARLCDFVKEFDCVFPMLEDRSGVEDYIQKRISNNAGIILWEEGQEIIGTFMYEFLDGETVEASYALVRPDHLREGGQLGMIQYALSTEPNVGAIKKVRAQTWDGNARSQTLFEKCGFQVIKRIPGDMHPERTTVIYETDFGNFLSFVSSLKQ